jgi:hypothetical protein
VYRAIHAYIREISVTDRQRKARPARTPSAQQPTRADDPEHGVARIAYQDPETDTTIEVPLKTTVFVVLSHATATWGRERVEELLAFAAALVKRELSPIDHQRLQLAQRALERYIAQWDNPAELALLTSYKQLWTGALTDAEAATLATALLNKRVSAATWRKRVDRWAAHQGLPSLQTARGGVSAAERAAQESLLDDG